MHRYSNLIVAMICHDANLGMQKAHASMRDGGTGAIPKDPFIIMDTDLLDAAIEGVARARRVGTDLSPRAHHEEWVSFLTARGWRAGPKNVKARTHPNLVGWDELTPEEQDKSRVFLGIVVTLSAEGMVA